MHRGTDFKPRRGRPRKIDLMSNDEKIYLTFKHRGALFYTFNVEYHYDGPVVVVDDLKATVALKDYPLERVIGNCGQAKVQNLVKKALYSDGVDKTISVVFSTQLQPYLE